MIISISNDFLHHQHPGPSSSTAVCVDTISSSGAICEGENIAFSVGTPTNHETECCDVNGADAYYDIQTQTCTQCPGESHYFKPVVYNIMKTLLLGDFLAFPASGNDQSVL